MASIRCKFALFLLVGLFATAQSVLAQSDTEPPQLVQLVVDRASVDVTDADQSVTFTLRVTDDLSGIGSGSTFGLTLTSPSGMQSLRGFAFNQPGSALDVTAQISLTIPRFSLPGEWTISIDIRDNVGNSNFLSAAALAAVGFPSMVTVFDATPDLQGPQLAAISLSPASVDVSGANAVITADLTLTDDVSGVGTPANAQLGFDFQLTSPSGKQSRLETLGNSAFQLVSGDTTNGVWRQSITMPQFSEQGIWTLSSLTVRDLAGNVRNYMEDELALFGAARQVTVTASPADTTPPQVVSLDITPTFIDTSAGVQAVNVNLGMSDDLSGVSFLPDSTRISQFFGAMLTSPSGAQSVFSQFQFTEIPPTTGTPQNGNWVLTLPFPMFSEAGTWTLRLFLKDATRNLATYSSAQLVALGFPTTLEVIRPSLVTDGMIGVGGGTVTDSTFGERAAVTFPAGALASNTTIAIDVLTTAPAIPSPAGFLAGTFFVNINLSPVPAMPFAPPGLTVTLPLAPFRAPGTPVTLFRLDPISGALVPAVSVTGGTVIGTANADGLSATFAGVAHLSTLVGFVANTVLGDVNGDALVNCADVAIVKASFGKRAGQPGFDARADLTRDGRVNVVDLTIVSRRLPAGVKCP